MTLDLMSGGGHHHDTRHEIRVISGVVVKLATHSTHCGLFTTIDIMASVPRWVEPVILNRGDIALDPLVLADKDGLSVAASDGELWNLWYTEVPVTTGMEAYIERALAGRVTNGEMPFTVRRDGRIVGTTRFCNVDPRNRRLEIGYTWYSRSSQQTHVNTACKLLLLEHAFETLGCIAVEFRTHWMNHQSRRAIERLGARQDGVLRNHRILSDGTIRDTVVYSIIQSEWPAVNAGLNARLRNKVRGN
jgi:RimJ/RimL family protein N-acetyltransferase